MEKELCKPCNRFRDYQNTGSKVPHVNDRIKCDLKRYEDRLSEKEIEILKSLKEQGE